MTVTFQRIKEVEDWQFKPYEDKLKIATEVIKEALAKSKRPSVAFSGGKNSLVVLHMVLQYKPDVIVNFNNTGVEYPETVKYVRWLAREWSLNYHETRPNTSFWKIVKEHGFPISLRGWSSKSREPKCCHLLKTQPTAEFYNEMGIDCYFTGISAFESRMRKLVIARFGLMRKNVRKVGQRGHLKRPTLACYPVVLWTELDIWKYTEENELPVNPAYEKYGLDRTGCFCCTNYIGWQKVLARTHPRILKKILRMMGQSNLGDYENG